ncbi:MAG TPA: hypothetical protein VHQ65_13960 [Thermoanaerobaculia bacterium]|nr:hypothetical protein [Thermoanaerobaculia bacterium]
MARKLAYALVLTVAFAVTLALLPDDTARAERAGEVERVEVTNFPEVQQVAGTVSVEGPIRQAELVGFAEALAVPAAPSALSELVEVGVLDADGYGWATLSLAGEVRGRGGAGRVGALLVPDVDQARRAFHEGRLLFPLDVSAEIAAGAVWAVSESQRLPLAFPRYRIYLYNTSDRTVATRVYAYLSAG